MNILKYIFFGLHVLFILTTLILWLWFIEVILIQFTVIISWIINSNKCLITQIEYYLFNQTLTEFINNRVIPSNSKFIVPFFQRFCVWIIFIFSIIYHINNQIRILGERLGNFT